MGRDSLAGTEQGFVRAFLNRVLTIDAASGEIEEEDESEDVKKALDLGDEIENAQAAIEGGASFQPPPETPPKPRTPEQLRKETEHRRAVQRRANREQLVAAVGVLDYRLRDRVLAGALTTQDLLRVRAMLLIVAAAGWPGAGGMRSVGGVVSPHSTRQVLPMMGDDDRWPRMLALILHSLFDGQNPPIRQLKIELIHDQMPDDVIECWATCFWAAQAAAVASTDDHSSPAFNRRLVPLLERVYRLTGLTNQELQSVPVLEVMDKIGNRYAARMGVDAAAVMAAHRRTVAGLAVAQH